MSPLIMVQELFTLAPSFGEDDNRVMSEAGVRLELCPINEKGEFTNQVSDFAGQYVKEADKNIIKQLKENLSYMNKVLLFTLTHVSKI